MELYSQTRIAVYLIHDPSQEPFIPWVTLEPLLTQLLQAVCQNDPDTTYALLRRIVPEYTVANCLAAEAAPQVDPV